MKTIEYTVPMRTKIIYAPIGLMTSRNIFSLHNEYLLKEASDFITNIHLLFKNMFGSEKAVIHSGNLGQHGTIINDHLQTGGYKTTLHEQGRLKQTLEQFLEGDTTFLIVVSAEYGFDFKDIDVQFILKVPFAAMDERLRALERAIGKQEFSDWYARDALDRLVQQSGRVGRGANSFGVTFILDSKFAQMYQQYNKGMPAWFKERLLFL